MKGAGSEFGMTLIEVLVALLVLALGLLGAAAVQLKALQYTDSARMSTQASFIAHGMLERIRTSTPSDVLQAKPGEAASGGLRAQDLADFASDVANFAGVDARGRVDAGQGLYIVHITWDDSRASGSGGQSRELMLGSRLAIASDGTP
ncbi:type IV pilus modification protein PilV [Pseudomonas piscis]|uniref:type IV pilus modification protein PilV n=1 Tax=Pseudomonas piscis TaxID=2614538 RepID=UPI0039A730B6